jgi:hypothetical protein
MDMHSPSSERTSTRWIWIAVFLLGIVLALALIFQGGGGETPVY